MIEQSPLIDDLIEKGKVLVTHKESKKKASFLFKTFDNPAKLTVDKAIDADFNVILVDASVKNSIFLGKTFFDNIAKTAPKTIKIIKISNVDIDDSNGKENTFDEMFGNLSAPVNELENYEDKLIIPLFEDWLGLYYASKTNYEDTSEYREINSAEKCIIF